MALGIQSLTACTGTPGTSSEPVGQPMTGIEHGWLREARRLPSPNQDERPPGTDIDLLVVHNISLPPGQFGEDWIDDFFTNRLDPSAHPYFRSIQDTRVSSHLLIRRNGEPVQYVPFDRRAWHAGRSCFADRERCNDFSIGIELEGTDDLAYEPAQYEKLAAVTAILMRYYPGISTQRIVGHSDIAPERKTDPGPAFEWIRFQRLLGELI